MKLGGGGVGGWGGGEGLRRVRRFKKDRRGARKREDCRLTVGRPDNSGHGLEQFRRNEFVIRPLTGLKTAARERGLVGWRAIPPPVSMELRPLPIPLTKDGI